MKWPPTKVVAQSIDECPLKMWAHKREERESRERKEREETARNELSC